MSTYHHGDLRGALLRAAAKTLEKQGVDRLSLRQLARKAGVSHGAPYRHFPDRAALLAALAQDGFDRLRERLASSRGRAIGEAYVAFALEHPQRFRLMSGERSRETYAVLLEAFRARQEVPDPERAAAAAWALVHGLASLLLDGQFPQAGAQFTREVIGAVRFAGAQRSA